MTDRATLEALLARVVQGEGLNRELDAEIACAVNGFTMHEDSNPADGHFAFWHGKPWESLCSNCSDWPPYTASLDAALTLVPEGWYWSVSGVVNKEYHARIVPPTVSRKTFMGYWRETKSAPRALIAVCLKARMEAQLLSNP